MEGSTQLHGSLWLSFSCSKILPALEKAVWFAQGPLLIARVKTLSAVTLIQQSEGDLGNECEPIKARRNGFSPLPLNSHLLESKSRITGFNTVPKIYTQSQER